jgi:drug/metabolite transporter (DMT)-like permease
LLGRFAFGLLPAKHRQFFGVGLGLDVADGLPHLLGLPVRLIVIQGVLQGGLQGVIGIIGYSHAIRVLGVSRAVLFPAAVPAMSILIGIPLVGEIPNLEQVAGMVLVTAGLLTAVGLFQRLRRLSR